MRSRAKSPHCEAWEKNKTTNPLTHQKIKEGGRVYRTLARFCGDASKHCGLFLADGSVNPATKKKLSENSEIKAMFSKLCISEVIPARKKAAEGKVTDVCRFTAYSTPSQCTLYDTVTLKDHQFNVCKYLMKRKPRGLILFHSVGSGKTITAITVIRCILEKDPKKKVFILTPKSLVENFQKEINKLNIKFGKNVSVYSHRRFAMKVEKDGANFCKNAVIVIDEAHNFKTIGGKNVKELFKATSAASNVFLLTATPVQNRPVEIANLYAMITKKEKEVRDVARKIEESSRSVLLNMFKDKISYFKNNDKSEYPSVSYHNVEFRMTKRYYELYMQVENNERDKFDNIFNAANLQIFYNGIRRAVNVVDESVTTPKIEWTMKHIKIEVKKNRKVLVYSNWLAAGSKLVQSRLNELNIPWVEVTGSQTSKARKMAVAKYNSHAVKVLFISSAGAEGLDLKETMSVIVLEPHWNNEKIKQVVGRAVRYRSHSELPEHDRQVDVYNLMLKKPANKKKDRLASADDYLMDISTAKDVELDKFYDILMEASI